MAGYIVKINDMSRDLSKKERIQFKDTSDAIKLDEATNDSGVIINPDAYVVLGIHNEKSDNVDYNNYLIIDKNGTKYVTGSESFWSSFIQIWEEMQDGEPEDFSIKAYKLDSKNYKGKKFLTCSII